MASQNLLATLVDTGPERKPPSQSTRTLRTIAFVVAWVITIYTTAILMMWLAWDTLSWWAFWTTTGIALLAFPFALYYWNRLNQLQSGTLSRSLLREILTQINDRLMPPISIQPIPMSLSGETEQFGSFDCAPMIAAESFPVFWGNSYITLAIIGVMSIISIMALPSIPSLTAPLITIFLTPFLLIFVLVIFLISFAIRSLFKRLSVIADGSGINWRFGAKGKTKHMDWHQARALLRITFTANSNSSSSSSSSPSGSSYVLIGSDSVLIWSVSTNGRARIFGDSERLLGAIVAHTKLPLRDATQLDNALSKAGKSTLRLLDFYGLTKHLSQDLLLDLQNRQHPLLTKQWIIGAVVAVMLTILPLTVGWWMQSYSSSYFVSLGQRIAAEQPLYRTSFASVDGAWPNLPSDSYFAQGMYEIHDPLNKERRIASLAGYTFGNAAYTVTATESGAVPDGSDDGIGLIIHASTDNSDFVAFDVKYDGSWELWHYSLQLYSPDNPDGIEFLDNGTSNAVHQGPGATNTLMIAAYDHSALLFINGHFIEQYQPQDYNHVDLSLTGSAGVFLNSAAMTGDFTSFAVSPAPPVDFWEMVRTAPPWHG